MNALYIMRYLGASDSGYGVIFIGRGTILGVDIGNIRYAGSYTESSDRIHLKGTMKATQPGSKLVTKQVLPVGHELQLIADWPASFADGSPQKIVVGGHPVEITLEKIGDLP